MYSPISELGKGRCLGADLSFMVLQTENYNKFVHFGTHILAKFKLCKIKISKKVKQGTLKTALCFNWEFFRNC